MVGLDEDLAWQLAATGATGDLGEELKDALGRAEVGQAEGEVRADDADQRNAVDVMTLGDHLGADQQVDLASVQAGEQPLHIVPRPRTVSRSMRPMRALGKSLLQAFLALLRARAEVSRDARSGTFWAELWDGSLRKPQ